MSNLIISSSRTLSTADLQTSSNWPIQIYGSSNSTTVVTITGNATIPGSYYFEIITPGYVVLDGGGYTMTITSATSGIVKNGTNAQTGFPYVTIQNFVVSSSNGVYGNGGFLCREYFGGTSNFIKYCSAYGSLNGSGAGGICGAYAGNNNGVGTTLEAINCFFIGTILLSSVNYCGGIFGRQAAQQNGSVIATNCYSVITNITSSYNGGIFGGGVNNSVENGTLTAQNCYFSGSLDTSKSNGAIYGGLVGKTLVTNNCFWLSGQNPYGSLYSNATNNNTNVYNPDGSWNDTNANTALAGTPASTPGKGTTWTSNATGNPYVLSSYTASYSPSSQTVTIGSTTTAGPYTGGTYSILTVNGSSNSNFTINTSTGVITANQNTPKASYDIVVYYLNTNQSYYVINIAIAVVGTFISTSQDLNSSFLQTSSNWPITISGGTQSTPTIITLKGDASIPSSTNGYFIIASSYVTIDGGGYTMTVNNIINFGGLIQNGTLNTNGYSYATIQNINVVGTNGARLANSQGWVCASYFGSGASNNLVQNCSSSGDISGLSTGGIFGAQAGSNGGTTTATNCYSTGDISSSGQYSGGIYGSSAGFSGTATASNCYSTGAILGQENGGIFGSDAGYSGTATATNCYSTGTISNQYSGGIFGSVAGKQGGTANASNCYSTGAISGQYSGGIFGLFAGDTNGTVNATNCYSTGAISGQYSGGITASGFGYNTSQTCSITNCYSLGNITGDNAGGICGAQVGYNDSNSPLYTPIILIQNCYVWGSIQNTGNTAGGILGGIKGFAYTNTPKVSILNSYILQSGNLIATGLQIKNSVTQTYIYQANGSWSDTDAKNNLNETPTSTPGKGTTWTSNATGNPYVLSSYTASYSPSSQTVTIGISLTTTAGPYTGGTYSILTVNGSSNSNFTINASTGVITVNQNTPKASYDIVVYYLNTNQSYYVINFAIAVESVAGTTISKSQDLNSNFLQTSSNWPITISGGTQGNPTIVTLKGDATMPSSTNGYFIIASSYVTIDGGGYTMTVNNISNFGGLIQNGTETTNGYSNTTIKNINVAGTNGATLAEGQGWVCASYFGSGTSNNLVQNCSSSGDISSNNSGGIFGFKAGFTNGTTTATYCYSTGIISGKSSGGIFGPYAGYNGGTATATNCYSTGLISGQYSGGITGDYFGYNTSQTCSITDCYSLGNITGDNTGGICGARVGYNNTSVVPNILIQKCYVWGSINDTSGGILGGTGGSTYTNTPKVSILNSYMLKSGNLIATSLQISVTQSNIYQANGAWNDTNAQSLLSGTPSSFPGSGTTWTSAVANTPFVISSSQSGVPVIVTSYTQDSQTVSTGGTTSPGPYTGGIYSISTVNGSTVLNPNYYSINSATGVITISSGASYGTYDFVVYYQGSIYFLYLSVTVPGLPCLVKGMRIRTPSGQTAVEDLKEGDLVITSRGESVPIIKIMSTSVIGNEETLPYVIQRHSLGIGKPVVDVYLSKNHAYYHKNHWRVPGNTRLERKNDWNGKEIEYYHIKTENYEKDKLWCEGIVVDSWKDES